MMTSPVRYYVTAETVGLRDRTNPGYCLIDGLTVGLRSMEGLASSRNRSCRRASAASMQ